MRIPTLMTSTLSAWIMAIVYDLIETMTGMEFRALLYIAIAIMVISLYVGCRENKETTRGEA